jgi:hypothetical protein
MVVIRMTDDYVWCNVSKTKAAELVGVDRSTILRWMKKAEDNKSNVEEFNGYLIYFQVETCKKSGYIMPMLSNK